MIVIGLRARMNCRPPSSSSSAASTISPSVTGSARWRRCARPNSSCSRSRRSWRSVDRRGRWPDRRLGFRVGLRRSVVSRRTVRLARPPVEGHRQRAAQADAGPRRRVRRHLQGAADLHLQSNIAGALYPARHVPPLSGLHVRCGVRCGDSSPAAGAASYGADPALRMRTVRCLPASMPRRSVSRARSTTDISPATPR